MHSLTLSQMFLLQWAGPYKETECALMFTFLVDRFFENLFFKIKSRIKGQSEGSLMARDRLLYKPAYHS